MESGIHNYKEMQISWRMQYYFSKTTDHYSHNERDEKFKVPITKPLNYGLQSITSNSIRDWNSLNKKTNIELLILK